MVVLTASCVVSSPQVDQAGQPIIGGTTTSTAMYPSVVGLETTPGNWFCTGTLIDKDWVLTAAHCVVDEAGQQINVRFGDDDINDNAGGTVVAAAEVDSDPGFDENLWDNDIAVIKLAHSMTDRAPTPVDRTALAIGTATTKVGYGDADDNGNGAGILRQVTQNTADCAGAGDPGVSNANLLCYAPGGKASCYGDSGGPAFVTVNGQLQVAGVTSGGTGNACTDGWDLYTSVAAEIAYVDMYVPVDEGTGSGSGSGVGSGSGDGGGGVAGGGGSGSGTDGGPAGDGGTDPTASQMGGCSAGGGGGASWLFGLAIIAVATTRRRDPAA